MAGKGFTGQPGPKGTISSQESEGCTLVAKAPQSPPLQRGGSNSTVYLPYLSMLSFILGHYFTKVCLLHLHTHARTRMQECTRMYTRTRAHQHTRSYERKTEFHVNFKRHKQYSFVVVVFQPWYKTILSSQAVQKWAGGQSSPTPDMNARA